ncbi:hypothetical protein BKH43_06120 [Helicobacter sp. 13S00401-1]|uniref:hypothetical protein n=1 Tax=Helicobacter sp. 13S00401-1 TaxID=1905758 RepID=UPI000BA57660|nr:hypothetical protein [Helicobacter sp. 13S00401-1]PAF50066.1 hypothetical protein BKH43_06120 [Helicobacter sp. 13S00401-1]
MNFKLASILAFLLALMLTAFSTTLNAKPLTPTFSTNLVLKKDEVYSASIDAKKFAKQSSVSPKNLTLRWTLFKNKGLVVLLKYDNFPYQFILYKDGYKALKFNSFTLNLLDPNAIASSPNQPNLKLYFKDIKDGSSDLKARVTFKLDLYGDVSLKTKR